MTGMAMNENEYDARLCIAASEHDADMYYGTGFLVPDACIFFEKNGRKYLVLTDLELERGKQDARVDEILAFAAYRERLEKQGCSSPKLIDVANCVLRDYQIRRVAVPGNFALQYADGLRERGYAVHVQEPFWEARMQKTAAEIAAIQQTQQANEQALDAAIQVIRASEIGADQELYYQGRRLTAEFVQRQIQLALFERDCLAQGTIVSCGDQATRPHERGAGPLRAHQAIIIDIFPQSLTSRYFGDLTRTIVKGRASAALKRMYAVVQAGQELACHAIRAGVNGRDVHRQVQDLFAKEGYETGLLNGTMQGFFHGTGHGVGLEIHEAPRLGQVDATLQAGNVVTVEPGLYYIGIGGVRLEDLVVVTANGCTNLTTYPKELEVA